MQEIKHSGHRERLMQKLSEFPESFSDHELLEVLLFYFIPRKNTNEIAHDLINAFGDIAGVFSATAEELSLVNGIGKKTAASIVMFSRIIDRVYLCKENKKRDACLSFDKIRDDIAAMFCNCQEEKFCLVLLDGKFRFVFKKETGSRKISEIITDLTEFAKVMTGTKAVFAVIAHNHPSGNVTPSSEDDEATMKFYILCVLHGINLADHIIFGGDKLFSYRNSGRLENIVSKANNALGSSARL